MTKGSDTRPVRRVLDAPHEVRRGRTVQYVVELRATLILIRPKGTRIGGKSEVAIPVSAAYLRAVMVQVEDARRAKRKGPRRVKRGAL